MSDPINWYQSQRSTVDLLVASVDPTLPVPWKSVMDESSGLVFYWNPETNVSQYEHPNPAPPPPPHPPPDHYQIPYEYKPTFPYFSCNYRPPDYPASYMPEFPVAPSYTSPIFLPHLAPPSVPYSDFIDGPQIPHFYATNPNFHDPQIYFPSSYEQNMWVFDSENRLRFNDPHQVSPYELNLGLDSTVHTAPATGNVFSMVRRIHRTSPKTWLKSKLAVVSRVMKRKAPFVSFCQQRYRNLRIPLFFVTSSLPSVPTSEAHKPPSPPTMGKRTPIANGKGPDKHMPVALRRLLDVTTVAMGDHAPSGQVLLHKRKMKTLSGHKWGRRVQGPKPIFRVRQRCATWKLFDNGRSFGPSTKDIRNSNVTSEQGYHQFEFDVGDHPWVLFCKSLRDAVQMFDEMPKGELMNQSNECYSVSVIMEVQPINVSKLFTSPNHSSHDLIACNSLLSNSLKHDISPTGFDQNSSLIGYFGRLNLCPEAKVVSTIVGGIKLLEEMWRGEVDTTWTNFDEMLTSESLFYDMRFGYALAIGHRGTHAKGGGHTVHTYQCIAIYLLKPYLAFCSWWYDSDSIKQMGCEDTQRPHDVSTIHVMIFLNALAECTTINVGFKANLTCSIEIGWLWPFPVVQSHYLMCTVHIALECSTDNRASFPSYEEIIIALISAKWTSEAMHTCNCVALFFHLSESIENDFELIALYQHLKHVEKFMEIFDNMWISWIAKLIGLHHKGALKMESLFELPRLFPLTGVMFQYMNLMAATYISSENQRHVCLIFRIDFVVLRTAFDKHWDSEEYVTWCHFNVTCNVDLMAAVFVTHTTHVHLMERYFSGPTTSMALAQVLPPIPILVHCLVLHFHKLESDHIFLGRRNQVAATYINCMQNWLTLNILFAAIWLMSLLTWSEVLSINFAVADLFRHHAKVRVTLADMRAILEFGRWFPLVYKDIITNGWKLYYVRHKCDHNTPMISLAKVNIVHILNGEGMHILLSWGGYQGSNKTQWKRNAHPFHLFLTSDGSSAAWIRPVCSVVDQMTDPFDGVPKCFNYWKGLAHLTFFLQHKRANYRLFCADSLLYLRDYQAIQSSMESLNWWEISSKFFGVLLNNNWPSLTNLGVFLFTMVSLSLPIVHNWVCNLLEHLFVSPNSDLIVFSATNWIDHPPGVTKPQNLNAIIRSCLLLTIISGTNDAFGMFEGYDLRQFFNTVLPGPNKLNSLLNGDAQEYVGDWRDKQEGVGVDTWNEITFNDDHVSNASRSTVGNELTFVISFSKNAATSVSDTRGAKQFLGVIPFLGIGWLFKVITRMVQAYTILLHLAIFGTSIQKLMLEMCMVQFENWLLSFPNCSMRLSQLERLEDKPYFKGAGLLGPFGPP